MKSMTDGGQGQEMREVIRWYPVFYLRIYNADSNKILGHLVDISEKGLMLICDGVVPINKEYQLRMRLPAQMKDRREILFRATSRWCKADANPDFFLAGFHLRVLESATRELILALIRDFSYNQQ
jgi:hypothetical protein